MGSSVQVNIILLASRAGNTTYVDSKNNKFSIQVNKCMKQSVGILWPSNPGQPFKPCRILLLAETEWHAGSSDQAMTITSRLICEQKFANFCLAYNDVKISRLCLLTTNYLCRVSTIFYSYFAPGKPWTISWLIRLCCKRLTNLVKYHV